MTGLAVSHLLPTEAGRAIAKLQALVPGISLAHFGRGRVHEMLFEGLRLAGMPEE
jgi:hypothetical protein